MSERMTGDEAAALIEGFDQERWYAEGTRVMREAEGYGGDEEIVDVDGFRDEECDPGVARIMAAGPRALLAVVELTRERNEARASVSAMAVAQRALTTALAALRETPAGEGGRC